MNFFNSMRKYEETGNAGNCPICDEKLKVKSYTDRLENYTAIACTKCNKYALFSGTTTKSGT